MARKEEICIAQIVRELKQGRTTPYLCKDDDKKQHVVKGKNATIKGLIHEWICAVLGTAFGLPIPDFSVAWADIPLREKRELFEYNFASSFVENIQDVTVSTLSELPINLINDLYVFDYWIKNADRNLTDLGGNPNFFIHQKTGNAYVMDHNLAFDDTFDIEQHKKLHVCAKRKQWSELFEVEKDRYIGLIENALTSLDEALNTIPDEWLERFSLDEIKQEVLPILNRYKEEGFWEAIK
ncbi:hypothetical protein KW507_22205 [Vibrio fluvialis]|nr:hypothetical protein [Vibrio vulnificus]MBY7903563.1 hypothetical protein [Vibrio fluvialis]MBY7942197.1 hypothetical protein [Vibrio fluvialis]MBY8169367.1 hypothetical protein [Vibrio fluvialis]